MSNEIICPTCDERENIVKTQNEDEYYCNECATVFDDNDFSNDFDIDDDEFDFILPDNIRYVIHRFLEDLEAGVTNDDTLVEVECRAMLGFSNKDDMKIFLLEELSPEKRLEVLSKLNQEVARWSQY